MFGELFLALLIALALALLFGGLGRPGPWGGFLWFFLVVFLGAWAIGLWVEPVGPALWGVAWVPIVFGGLLLALLVAAIPPAGTGVPAEPPAEPAATEAAAAVGLFFWLLIFGLLIAVALALLF